jgi:hypothetical protein
MLWNDETITAPARAPEMKLIHIGARTWMVRRAEFFEESSLRLRLEKRRPKLFCISVVTIPVM